MLALALPSISSDMQLSERQRRRARYLYAARDGRRRPAVRLARGSRRSGACRVVVGAHVHGVHEGDRRVPYVLADRGDAVRFGNWYRRALHGRHAARGGVRADARAHDRARHAASRLVGRFRRRGAARRVLLPRFGWRPLFACAVVPGIVALALLWNAPDPPSWAGTRRDPTRPRPAALSRRSGPIRPVRRTLSLWTVASIALQFGYYGANTWLPSYLVRDLGVNVQSMGWYIAGTYTMMVIGKIVAGYLADMLGRRVMWIVAGVLTAALSAGARFRRARRRTSPYLLLVFGFLYARAIRRSTRHISSESFPAGVRANRGRRCRITSAGSGRRCRRC